MTLTIVLIIIGAVTLYIACGVLAYGLTLAYFQQKWAEVRDAQQDRLIAGLMAIGGPAGLLVALVTGAAWGGYGLQYHAVDSAWAVARRKSRDSTP